MKKYTIFISIIFLSSSLMAQFGPPGGGPPCWPPPCVPIDGGITIFAIVAAFFGFKNLSKIK